MTVIDSIRKLAKKESIEFTRHARTKMFERGIESTEVKQCLLSGKMIEEYLDDKHYPSFLLCEKFGHKYYMWYALWVRNSYL